jgi:hypothetical protein
MAPGDSGILGRESRAADSPHLGTSMLGLPGTKISPVASWLARRPVAASQDRSQHPGAKIAQSVSRLGTVAARRSGVCSSAKGRQ